MNCRTATVVFSLVRTLVLGVLAVVTCAYALIQLGTRPNMRKKALPVKEIEVPVLLDFPLSEDI
ncbi:hypothetical protein [Pajaroellobacter abortibovis]|nr:hypothetical protein [Pajaroellobacter abortibovis]